MGLVGDEGRAEDGFGRITSSGGRVQWCGGRWGLEGDCFTVADSVDEAKEHGRMESD